MKNLTLKNVSKSFNGIPALTDVYLNLRASKIHALMGANGAGKTTLIKLLAGVVKADSISVFKDGVEIIISSSGHAKMAGFCFIHQEVNVIPQTSVAENILLSSDLPHRFGFRVDWPAVYNSAKNALDFLGVTHIDARAPVGGLSAGDKMMVMIASAFVAGKKIKPILYVFDEPTATLTQQECELLFSVLKRLKDQGAAILYVSHRIDEIMRICDDVSILRDGVMVETGNIKKFSKTRIIQSMTGRDLVDTYPKRTEAIMQKTAVELKNIKTEKLENINFDLKAGEILGVTGLANSGQSSLLHLMMGVEKVVDGDGLILGKALPKCPHSAWSRRIAYIPRERRSEGLCLNMSVTENVVLSHLKSYGFHAKPRLENKEVIKLGKRVRLKSSGAAQIVNELSGGNQQKVLFARSVKGNPGLLLLDEPTRGVDIGAKYDIYSLVRELSNEGCSVIITSSDLPEILGMCDRILVLQAGRQTKILDRGNLTSADLLSYFYFSDKL